MICTRGDHQPLIALSVAMLNSGEFGHLHLYAHEENKHLIPKDSRITALKMSTSMDQLWPLYYYELFKVKLFGWFNGKANPFSMQANVIFATLGRMSTLI